MIIALLLFLLSLVGSHLIDLILPDLVFSIVYASTLFSQHPSTFVRPSQRCFLLHFSEFR